MKSSRWLLIFGIIVGILVITTVTLVLTLNNNKNTSLLPADSPDGTLQRYFVSIKNSDFGTAYSYLSPQIQTQMPYSQWIASYNNRTNQPSWQVTLGKPVLQGNQATIDVAIDSFVSSGPFGNPVNSRTVVFTLENQNGLWKITSPDYLWSVFY